MDENMMHTMAGESDVVEAPRRRSRANHKAFTWNIMVPRRDGAAVAGQPATMRSALWSRAIARVNKGSTRPPLMVSRDVETVWVREHHCKQTWMIIQSYTDIAYLKWFCNIPSLIM